MENLLLIGVYLRSARNTSIAANTEEIYLGTFVDILFHNPAIITEKFDTVNAHIMER